MQTLSPPIPILSAAPRGPWEQTARRLPQGQGRFTCPVTGLRFYPIPDGKGNLLAVPGVTSILSSLQSAEDIDRLASWRAREVAAGRDPDEGRNRGSAVHALLEGVVRGDGTSLEPPDGEHTKLTSYASGMEKYLRPYESFLWNERPLKKGWEHCWSAPPGDPTRLARVWSLRWGFAGTPDLIARRRWSPARNLITVVGDFKSSNKPYFRSPGTPVPQHHKVGYKKYCKTVLQLAAYAIGIEETLGLAVDQGQIIVGLPEPGKAQMFHILKPELTVAKEKFRRACVKFWKTQAQLAIPLAA